VSAAITLLHNIAHPQPLREANVHFTHTTVDANPALTRVATLPAHVFPASVVLLTRKTIRTLGRDLFVSEEGFPADVTASKQL
jgi:hypothetical protein